MQTCGLKVHIFCAYKLDINCVCIERGKDCEGEREAIYIPTHTHTDCMTHTHCTLDQFLGGLGFWSSICFYLLHNSSFALNPFKTGYTKKKK